MIFTGIMHYLQLRIILFYIQILFTLHSNNVTADYIRFLIFFLVIFKRMQIYSVIRIYVIRASFSGKTAF